MQTYLIDEAIAEIIRHRWDDSRERAVAIAAHPAAATVRENVQSIVNVLEKVGTESDVQQQRDEAEKAKSHFEQKQAEADEAVRVAKAAQAQAEAFEGLALKAEQARARVVTNLAPRVNALAAIPGVSLSALIGQDLAQIGFQVDDRSARIHELKP